jgi:hypothetical protein
MLDLFFLPNFAFYLIAGAIGAFVISIGRFFLHTYIPNFPDMPLVFGRLIDWGKPEPEHTARILGSYLHVTLGALWGFLFGQLVEGQFFFVEFTVVSGILFAIIPWLFLMVVLLPLAGKGFFGTKISKYQWLIALLLHIIYGAAVALLISVFVQKSF